MIDAFLEAAASALHPWLNNLIFYPMTISNYRFLELASEQAALQKIEKHIFASPNSGAPPLVQ